MTDQAAQTEAAEAKTMSSGKPTVTVKVYAPFHVYYEGEAYSLSAVNDVGPFDILPRHHNFLCMLVPCDLRIATLDKGEKIIKINRALMQVKSDHITVFVDV